MPAWTAKELERAAALNARGVPIADIAAELKREWGQVRDALRRRARRLGLGKLSTPQKVDGLRRRGRLVEILRGLPRNRPLPPMADIAAELGCEAKTVRLDLVRLGMIERFDRARPGLYRRLGRDANLARYEGENLAAAQTGWPLLPAGQVRWLAVGSPGTELEFAL